jgi:hypothetical protein
MKRKIFYVLIILVFVTISTNLLDGVPQEEWDADNFGRIIGQILDTDTGEPVSEVFKIDIFNCSDEQSPIFLFSVKSDEKGYFTKEIMPGIYCIWFSPTLENSKYGYENPIVCNTENKNIINVEAGKISKFFKKARPGGKLKLILVDENGIKFVPNSIYSPSDMKKISVDIENSECLDGIVSYNTTRKDRLDDGEMQLNCLPPGEYNLKIYLSSVGYPPIFLENVKIERGITTEKSVLVDLNDMTGIEGTVRDQYGNPIENADIDVVKEGKTEYFASKRTDSNGYYKIIGLISGIYELILDIDLSDTEYIIKRYQNIHIFKNKISRKDIVITVK